MNWRTAALAATLVFPAVALLASPVSAQTCQPPSAEHAFEELLDVAADDSPLEDEAWRIADEQEARGEFESPETIRMIDDLARANDLAYDCASRMYFPVSGPDPRIAIENGEEPPETAGGEPGPGAPASGTTGGGGAGSPSGPAAGETPAAGEPTGAAGAVVDGVVAVPGGPASPGGAGGGGGMRPAGTAAAAPGEDGVALPDGAPDGRGGAVALPAGSEGGGNGRTAGMALLAAAALATMVMGARTGRRRRSRELA